MNLFCIIDIPYYVQVICDSNTGMGIDNQEDISTWVGGEMIIQRFKTYKSSEAIFKYVYVRPWLLQQAQVVHELATTKRPSISKIFNRKKRGL